MLPAELKDKLRPYIPGPILQTKRRVWNWLRDEPPLTRWELSPSAERRWLAARFWDIHKNVTCVHTQAELARVVNGILSVPRSVPGCIVEAGCFKGGSTAKLSIIAKLTGRRLVVFDSFEGIPSHTEEHASNIFGQPVAFPKGSYEGTLEEVKHNVSRYGELDCCQFVKGWFENTLPDFKDPVAGAFVDVDLASSTRTCLQYLYPRLVPGGYLFSHDGHLPLCVAVFNDPVLWTEIGVRQPRIEGLGRQKLVTVRKKGGLNVRSFWQRLALNKV